MPDRAEPRPSLVFLSFAGIDRPAAKCLSDALLAWGVETFIDKLNIEPGEDIFERINEALTESNYFVLLWSRNTVGNTSVALELSAAILRALEKRRSFLFVVKLDDTDPPLLLASRKYVEHLGDWDAVAEQLAAVWRRDRATGRPVFPAPHQRDRDRSDIEIYVYNDDLNVAHTLMVPPGTTGVELMAAARESLRLKDSVSLFDGQVGMRLSYRLEHDGRQIPANKSLAELPVTEHGHINLQVHLQWFWPKSSGASRTFRPGESGGPSKAMRNRLLTMAFGHLAPGQFAG